MLMLDLIADPEHGSGLLVHCISGQYWPLPLLHALICLPVFCHCACTGWDRTPLFISLLRLSLWADGEVHRSLNAAQMLYNSKIPGIVESHVAKGHHVIGVDMSKMPLSGLTTASVHPNDQGYAYMAGIWYAAIKDLLPK